MSEFSFLLSLLVGLLFLQGRGIVFGFEGGEPFTLPIPENHIIGWIFISFSLVWLFPPWLVARISRAIRRIIKRQENAKKEYLERITKETLRK